VTDLISGPSIKTDTSSRQGGNGYGSAMQSPKAKHDLPFKRRTMSIAVTGEKKPSYLNREGLDSLQGDGKSV
jgi:hypothetical protein